MGEETITYYEACYSGILGIEIVKETDKFVLLPNGRRKSKDSEYGYFIRKTREEAKQALIQFYKDKCTTANRVLEAEQYRLHKVEEL